MMVKLTLTDVTDGEKSGEGGDSDLRTAGAFGQVGGLQKAFGRKLTCCSALTAQEGQGANYGGKTFFRLISHETYLPCLTVQRAFWVLG